MKDRHRKGLFVTMAQKYAVSLTDKDNPYLVKMKRFIRAHGGRYDHLRWPPPGYGVQAEFQFPINTSNEKMKRVRKELLKRFKKVKKASIMDTYYSW